MVRRGLVFFLFALVLWTASGCSGGDPPVTHESRTGADEYGQYKSYVCAFLEEKEVKILPSVSAGEIITGYSYEYKCALFGNPSFAIWLRVRFDDESFQDELARLTELCPEKNCPDGSQTVFWRRGTLNDYRSLKDSQVLDGNTCLFESARSLSADNTIEYLVSEQWEPAPIPDCVEAYFASIQKEPSP